MVCRHIGFRCVLGIEVKMMNAVFSKVFKNGLIRNSTLLVHNSSAAHSKLWEPDYLILSETKTPEYDFINVQIKGHDFVILEKYQKIIHRLAKMLKINVENAWATPPKELKVQKFKPKSSEVESEYLLKLYERNVQIVDAKSHIMSLFIEALITTCPAGVSLNVHEHTKEIEEDRYVPLFEVEELKETLDQIGQKT